MPPTSARLTRSSAVLIVRDTRSLYVRSIFNSRASAAAARLWTKRRPAPLLAPLAGFGRDAADDGFEKGYAFARIVDHRRRPERLLDAFAQSRRRNLGNVRRQRHCGGHERKINPRQTGCDAELADGIVEKRGQLRDVGSSIAVVGGRPLRQHPSRLGCQRQPVRRVLDRRHVVQRAGDIRTQRVEVGLASGRGVVSRTRGRRILIRTLPVDRRLGDTDKMQGRRRPLPARRWESRPRHGRQPSRSRHN